MTDDLSWNSALCVAGLRLTNEERAAGWPVAFTPENLACLQYPWGGSASEKKDSTNKRRVLLSTILKAIHSGALPAEERTRTEDITESRQEPDFFPPNSPYSGGFGSPDWRNRDRPRPMRTVTTKVGERTVPFFVIERAAFREWLVKQNLKPSEHVQTWFAATADDEEGLDTNSPARTEMKRSAIINQLERHYPSLEADLNRGEPWTIECRSGRRGMYYLDLVEEGCRKKWGERPSLPTIRTHKMVG